MIASLSELKHALTTGDRADATRRLQALHERAEVDDAIDILASAAADGNALATELLVEQLHERGLVRAAVRRYLFDEAAVEDVTQDTLLSVATGVHGFRGESRFTTWLFTVARHRVSDHLRRSRASTPLDDDVGEGVRISSLIATRATVQRVVAELPEPYGTVVKLRDIDGLGYDQVAERLGRNENTVRSQVTRGRALVAARLSPGDAP